MKIYITFLLSVSLLFSSFNTGLQVKPGITFGEFNTQYKIPVETTLLFRKNFNVNQLRAYSISDLLFFHIKHRTEADRFLNVTSLSLGGGVNILRKQVDKVYINLDFELVYKLSFASYKSIRTSDFKVNSGYSLGFLFKIDIIEANLSIATGVSHFFSYEPDAIFTGIGFPINITYYYEGRK